jgi:hypothetical protein
MKNMNIYEQLARHLDQWVVVPPISPAALKILETLFPDEEAETCS